MARKTNFLFVGVVLSVGLLACSSNATKTAETIALVTTTMVPICDPPNHLDCAGANLKNANLSGANLHCADLTRANLTGANLTGAKMPDGTIHD